MKRVRKMLGGLLGKSPGPVSLPRLPGETRIYAVGDIHGRMDLLETMAGLIRQDLSANPVEHATELFLGDYVDRGPDGAGVIEWLIKSPPMCHRRICLRGNHEEFLRGFIHDPSILMHWKNYGGVETLNSYGVRTSFQVSPDDAGTLHQQLCDTMPASHLDFLNALPLSHREDGYFFAHAGVNPEVPLDQQVADDLLWIREPFLNSDADFGAVVVHGHTPAEKPEIYQNRINVDTGAYVTNCLSCAVLDQDGCRIIAT